MYNLFQPDAVKNVTDQSIAYLYSIFGSVYGAIPNPAGTPEGQAAAGEGAVTLLSTMFKTFNGVILAVGALMVLYVTVIGVMQTAAEGEFMGKKWNNIWIPIRMVLGIALLVPTGSGYSALQVLMMWFIVQGVGAADTLWNTVLNFVTVVGSPNAQVSVGTVDTTRALTELYKGLTCYQSALIAKEAPYDASGAGTGGDDYFCYDKSSDPICTTANFSPAVDDLSMNKYGGSKTDGKYFSYTPAGGTGNMDCGVLQYCNLATACADPNSGSLACMTCTAQIETLSQIITVFAGIGQQLAQADYDYQTYYYQSSILANSPGGYNSATLPPPSWIQQYCSDTGNSSSCYGGGALPDPNGNGSQSVITNNQSNAVKTVYWPYAIEPTIGKGDFIATATNQYVVAMTNAITNYINSQGPANMSDTFKDASNYGWIRAGAYYHDIANKNSTLSDQSMPYLAYSYGSYSSPTDTGNAMHNYRNNYDAATCLQQTSAGNDCTGSTDMTQQVASTTNESVDNMNDTITTQLSSSSGDPLLKAASIGSNMLIAAEAMFGVVLILGVAAAIAGSVNAMVLGTGLTQSPFANAVLIANMYLAPPLLGMIGLLLTYGALLGIYLPLIPFVVFTFGAIGWLISVIEAMVAGPLVALGILSPSGEHELLGKAAPSIFLLLNIFLRPSLMIFGMMAAMLLASVVMTMINDTFYYVRNGLPAWKVQPVGFLLFLAVYISLVVSAMNKVFALIHLIPERVMTWISHHAGQGMEAPLSEVKTAAGEAASRSHGVAGEASGGAGKISDTHQKVKTAKKESKDANQTK
ncbi:MAG: hypothetical protein EPO11_08450 [Gammaproteobacteria bacterium]|nr:MAG: hypothetical protein EPO11_08450 [Gammaproteobacteria bacterium]